FSIHLVAGLLRLAAGDTRCRHLARSKFPSLDRQARPATYRRISDTRLLACEPSLRLGRALSSYLYERDGIDHALVELMPWHGAVVSRLLYDGLVVGHAITPPRNHALARSEPDWTAARRD